MAPLSLNFAFLALLEDGALIEFHHSSISRCTLNWAIMVHNTSQRPPSNTSVQAVESVNAGKSTWPRLILASYI